MYLMRFNDMEFEEIGQGEVLTGLVKAIKKEQAKVMDEKEKKDQDDRDAVCKQTKRVITKNVKSEEKVKIWNEKYPIGTKVKSKIIDDEELETRTEAMMLFGHRAAIYIKGYNGYFDLDEIIPIVKQA